MVDAGDRFGQLRASEAALDALWSDNRVNLEDVSVVMDVDNVEASDDGPFFGLIRAQDFVDLDVQKGDFLRGTRIPSGSGASERVRGPWRPKDVIVGAETALNIDPYQVKKHCS